MFTESLPSARHSLKSTSCFVSLNPHNNPIDCIIVPVHRWGNCGSEKVSHLPKWHSWLVGFPGFKPRSVTQARMLLHITPHCLFMMEVLTVVHSVQRFTVWPNGKYRQKTEVNVLTRKLTKGWDVMGVWCQGGKSWGLTPPTNHKLSTHGQSCGYLEFHQGICDWYIHTAVFKTDNQQGYAI